MFESESCGSQEGGNAEQETLYIRPNSISNWCILAKISRFWDPQSGAVYW